MKTSNSGGKLARGGEHEISALCRLIWHTVDDQKLAPTYVWLPAKAVDDGRLPLAYVQTLLDRIEDLREAGVLRKPGAYWVSSIRRLFCGLQHSWIRRAAMTQQTLWNTDGRIAIDTRRSAAAAIARLKPNMLRRVLAFVASRGHAGAIDEEIAEATGLRESTARAHRCELRDSGQVRDSGDKRRSRSGRLCIVWVATGKGLE